MTSICPYACASANLLRHIQNTYILRPLIRLSLLFKVVFTINKSKQNKKQENSNQKLFDWF